jgi:hypothetical protein
MWIRPKNTLAIASMTELMRSPNSPSREMAKPVRIETSRTCSRDEALLLGAVHVALHRPGIERGRIDVEAFAGLQQIADQKPERERDRRHRLEVDQRLHADPAHLLEIAHGADAVHDGAEDHRCDHHLDQRDETVAQRFESDAGVRKEMADEDADGDRDQDLNVENRIPGASRPAMTRPAAR